MPDHDELTEEMSDLLQYLQQSGPAQFPALLNEAMAAAGNSDPDPLERQVYFHAMQQLLGLGYLVPGADLQRPTWPWLKLTDRGARAAAARK